MKRYDTIHTMNTNTKITKATFKSFIKNNINNLYVANLSSFDGMTDCVQSSLDDRFKKVTTQYDPKNTHTLGIPAVWLVGDSRDYFTKIEKNGFIGIECYNCCGSFIVAIPKV